MLRVESDGAAKRRKVDKSTGSKTWEWGWYVCVELDAGQTPDAVNYLYFCHNARNLVSVGQRVKSGDALAVMGNTGNAALASPPFAHCHFEVRATTTGAGLDPTAYTGHPNAVGTYGEAIDETEDNDMKFLKVTSGKCEVFTAPDVNAVDKAYNGGRPSPFIVPFFSPYRRLTTYTGHVTLKPRCCGASSHRVERLHGSLYPVRWSHALL